MITVLNVIDTGGPGGAETVFLNTCTKLDASRFRAACVVSRDGWLADSLRARGLTPKIISATGSVNVSYLLKIMSTARDVKADVIAGHLYGSAIYCSLAGKLLGLPVVSVLHGQSDIASDSRFARLKTLCVRKGSSKLVFVSDQLRQTLQPCLQIENDQCVVIPNGVDAARFAGSTRPLRTELGIADDQLLVGAVGNIRTPKSYDVFLRAAQLLCKMSDRYRFVVAGEGSGRIFSDICQLRDQLGLKHKVTFLGLRSDIAEILRSLDVYVLSSTTEGFSIACIEAMASGTPVVATRSGGPEEILEHEVSGLLVPVKSPESIAYAVSRIASDRVLTARLVATALSRVASRYTLDTMLAAYGQLFTDLLPTAKNG